MKRYLVFIVFAVVFFSCSKDDEAENVPPSSLTYNTQNVFIKNTSVVNLVPTSTGGAVTSYSISPALPEGLSFNTETGVISGTPTVTVATTTYTVTATNSGGSTSFDFVVTVSDALPNSLSYNAQNEFYKDYSVVNLTPTVSGGAVASYSISSALPAGLSINVATGVISGTPTVAAPTIVYTVTATNSGGSTSFGVVITVNNQPSRIVSISRTSSPNVTEYYYYTYLNDLIFKENYRYSTPRSFESEESTYTYMNGRLDNKIKSKNSSVGYYPTIRTNYFYTGNLITSETESYSNSTTNFGYDSNDRLVSHNLYIYYEYFPDGNLYKRNTTPVEIYSSYDTKRNPFRLGGFTSEYLKLNAVPINNPTSMNNETYVYEYNVFDLPVKKTIYINGFLQSVWIYTYE